MILKRIYGSRRKNTRVSLVVGLLSLAGVFLLVSPAQAAETILASTNMLVSKNTVNGYGGDGNSQLLATSEDGNFVLMKTSATDLGTTGGSGVPMLKNISADTIARVDTSTSGVLANDKTIATGLSRTGRYVLMMSLATNLIDGTTTVLNSGQYHMYVKDMQTGVMEKISIAETSVPSGSGVSPLAISDDGRFAVFYTKYADHYVPGLRTGYRDLVLLDRATGDWKLVNAPASGSLQNIDTFALDGNKAMSCDGSFVVFESAATNLVSGYSGSGKHIYLADLRNGLKITDITAGATADSFNAVISCNGRYATFWTLDRTFVSPTPAGLDTNAHVVRYDRLTGDRLYADSLSNGSFNPGLTTSHSWSPVSDKGDVILQAKLYAGGTSYMPWFFLKHFSDGSGTLEHIQKKASGGEYWYDLSEGTPAISANGKYLLYRSSHTQSTGLTPSANNGDVVRAQTGL